MNRNLIPSEFNSTSYPYFENYFITGNPDKFDSKYMDVDYAALKVATDNVGDIKNLVTICVLNNHYKWMGLFNTTNFEYNPIWNVDGITTETRTIADHIHETVYGESGSTTTDSQVPDDMTTQKDIAQTSLDTDEHTDTLTDQGYIDTIETTRTGNIGVTMTQQLIEAERKVNDFVLYDIIFKDIIDAITIPLFEED